MKNCSFGHPRLAPTAHKINKPRAAVERRSNCSSPLESQLQFNSEFIALVRMRSMHVRNFGLRSPAASAVGSLSRVTLIQEALMHFGI